MNERIKELYDQSLIRETVKDSDGNPMLAIKQNPEKFAELIAKECLSYMEEGDIDFVKFMIKRNFGVDTLVEKSNCWCHTCRPISVSDPESVKMRLCPECGNKRCPKATNHIHACTDSNDSGQEGSIY